MNILVTGGAGFIGSHTVVELLRVDPDLEAPEHAALRAQMERMFAGNSGAM